MIVSSQPMQRAPTLLIMGGGVGIVGRVLSVPEVHNVFRKATCLVRTVPNLSGSRNLTYPERRIEATKPRSLLDARVFDETAWLPLQAGRWRAKDHNTLGEARGVIKLLDGVCLTPEGLRRRVLSLQDNQPVCGSFHKGRSPSPSLNYILRKKAARTLAFAIRLMLPWAEAFRMPADWLSRVRDVPSYLSGGRQ